MWDIGKMAETSILMTSAACSAVADRKGQSLITGDVPRHYLLTSQNTVSVCCRQSVWPNRYYYCYYYYYYLWQWKVHAKIIECWNWLLYSYIGRQSSASTATGIKQQHLGEVSNILTEAFN